MVLGCAALSVLGAIPAAMARGGERYGYYVSIALAALMLPALGGWLMHRFGRYAPNQIIIIVALMSLAGRCVSGLPSAEESRARRAVKASAEALDQAHAAGDPVAFDTALKQLAVAVDDTERELILGILGLVREAGARMDQHSQRFQAFAAAGGCTIVPSQEVLEARRVMLRPLRSSADDLCVYLRSTIADFERKVLGAARNAEHAANVRRELDEGAKLAIVAESCAAQVKQLAACDEQLALLVAHFGHWTIDAERVVNFDATTSDEVVAAFSRTVAQMAAEDATMERLEQLRAVPTPPK